MFLNLPTMLTWARIVSIPIIVGMFYLPWPMAQVNLAASCLFIAMAITDWADGWLARRLNQTSAFGAFLDPVADKLMVVIALVLLVQHHANFWVTAPAAIIIGRELVISALREWMAEMGARAQVAVSKLGKYKTALQMVALVVLLANPPELTLWVVVGYILLAMSAVLTLWSMVVYLIAAWPHLRPDSDQNSSK